MASVYTYNRYVVFFFVDLHRVIIGVRLPSVWGEDAEEWNPRRFLDSSDIKQTSLGVYANLCDFPVLLCSTC